MVLPNGIRLVSQSSRTAQVSLVPFSEDESLENSVDEEATQATTEEVDKAKEEGEGSVTNDSAAPGEQSVQDATSLATDTSVPSDNTATPEAVVQEE